MCLWWWWGKILRWGAWHHSLCQQQLISTQNPSDKLYDLWFATPTRLYQSMDTSWHYVTLAWGAKWRSHCSPILVWKSHQNFYDDVVHHGPKSMSPDKQWINFLWVRWFDLDVSFHGGWKALWLHHVGFLNAKSPTDYAFSFLDPSIIIHGAHIIPAFAHGQTLDFSILPNPLQGSHSTKIVTGSTTM